MLIIDPGSTSTKVGIYEEDRIHRRWTIRHERSEIEGFDRIADQESMRFRSIGDLLTEEDLWESSFDAVAGRGGLLKPLQGGTYEVGDAMLAELRAGSAGEHASNLGAILAAVLVRLVWLGSELLVAAVGWWWGRHADRSVPLDLADRGP